MTKLWKKSLRAQYHGQPWGRKAKGKTGQKKTVAQPRMMAAKVLIHVPPTEERLKFHPNATGGFKWV